MVLQTLGKWRATRVGLLVAALVELGAAYTLGSLAINSGSLWQWGLAIILVYVSVATLAKLLRSYIK